MARNPLIFHAEEGSVAVNGTLYSTRVTNIEVRGGGRDAEQIRTFGGGALLAERPQEIMETSISAIVSGIDFSRFVWGLGSTTAGGFLTSGDSIRSKLNVVYTVTDPSAGAPNASIRFRFTSGFGTESTMTLAADSQLEETFTFKCMAKDAYREFNSGGAANLVTPGL